MRFRRHREAADAATWRLLLLFALVLLMVVAVTNGALALAYRMSLPIARGYPALFFETNTAVVLLFVLGGCWVESLRLREGGAHVARLAGARQAQPSGSSSDAALERRLVNVVTELSLAAGTQAPAVWVLPRDESINAFAAGWTPEDSVVAVTQGALQRLTREELQGLVAHELGHLASGDTRLHMRLIGLVWGLQMLHGLGRSLLQRDERGRFHAGALLGLALWTVGYIGWLGGRFLQAAVSRQREFHADAAAVQYTRQVAGIGGALRKIAGLPPERGGRYDESLAHLWVSPPGKALRAWWQGWLATHPPLAERLQRLYGRPVEMLGAPVLPAPSADEELAPMLGAAPAGSTGSNRSGSSVAAGPGPLGKPGQAPDAAFAPTDPDTASHPPVRTKGWLRRPPIELAREKEALQRATFWRSAGERHAALLAWLIGPQADEAAWEAWNAAVHARAAAASAGKTAQAAPVAYAQALQEDMRALGPGEALALAARLADRNALGAPGERIGLARDARALAALTGHGAPRLRRLWLLRHLAARKPQAGRLSYEALQPARAAAALALSQAMGEVGARWLQAVKAEEGSAVAAAGPQGLRSAAGLRRLHAMHRPRLVKAWAAAAAAAGLDEHLPTLEAIVLACQLLHAPCPDSVAAALGDRQAQERIL